MAGRISQSFINDLLQRVNIAEVIGAHVPLKSKGKNQWGLCPFHDEKTASFSVNTESGFYKCFGCGVSGTALTFLMEHERLDFVGAVEALAERAGVPVEREGGNVGPPQYQRQTLELLEQVAQWYAQCLTGSQGEPARQYLRRRGIDQASIDRFGLGCAPDAWDALLRRFADHEPDLERAGLIVKREHGGFYDRFRDRLMFPIRNYRGRVIGFGGRVLGDGEPKYLNSPETEVFHKGRELYGLYECRRYSRALTHTCLVEGYMDVISLSQAGITESVASLGTATSADQLEALFRLAPEVVCCFDADNAGRKAAWRALEAALPVLSDERRLSFSFLPEGQDPDSFVQQGGAASWRGQMDQRQSFVDYFFATLGAGLDLSNVDDCAALSQRVAPLLQKLPQGVRVQLMRDRLRKSIGLSSARGDGARRQSRPHTGAVTGTGSGTRSGTNARFPTRGRAAARGPIRQPDIAQRALQSVLQHVALLAEVDAHWIEEWRATVEPNASPREALLLGVIRFLRERRDADVGAILGHFHGLPGHDLLCRLAVQPADDTATIDSLRATLQAVAAARIRQAQRRQLASIDTDEALNAQFLARQRRESEPE